VLPEGGAFSTGTVVFSYPLTYPQVPETSIPGKEDHRITPFHYGPTGTYYAIFLARHYGLRQKAGILPLEER
jgi:hypothetical protein